MADSFAGTRAAGGYKRIADRGSVSDLLRGSVDDGPSAAAFNSWKRHGIPTSEVSQTTTFGCSSRNGMGLNESGIQHRPLDGRHPSRNPITWEGFNPPERLREQKEQAQEMHSAAQKVGEHRFNQGMETSVSGLWAQNQIMPPRSEKPAQLQEEQMNQTWSELMRNGAIRPSAAMALVVCIT